MKLITKTLGTILLTVVLSASAFAGSNNTNFSSAETSQTATESNILQWVLDINFGWWQPLQVIPGVPRPFFRVG